MEASLGKPADKQLWEIYGEAQLGSPVRCRVCWQNSPVTGMSQLREIPMQEGRLIMTEAEVIARCDKNTIWLLPTLGVTFTGEL